ncbi:MAG: TonB-dependent receptor [Flavihumibacter sp.]
MLKKKYIFLACCSLLHAWLLRGQDSVRLHTLDSVQGDAQQNRYNSNLPQQLLSKNLLNRVHPQSVGDAAKMFAGVLVRDYGGIGGLKTISVRNLGASHTGVLLDGVPVADMQSGQVDLGRLSMRFVESISLSQAHDRTPLLPARSYVSAAILSIQSVFNQADTSRHLQYGAALDAGSFGWWKPSVYVKTPAGKRSSIGAIVEYNRSKGDYPYHIENGNQSSNAKRENADIRSTQAAVHFQQLFADSSTLVTRISWYGSARGLPGAIIFFNTNSTQRLTDNELAVQGAWRKKTSNRSALKIAGKFNNQYTRYLDPSFQNNAGYLENTYRQSEGWLSGSINYRINNKLSASWASDLSYAWLHSDMHMFAFPERWSNWNAAGLQFSHRGLDLNAVLLHSFVHDKVKTGKAPGDRNAFSPTIAAGWRPAENSPFLLRAFYKHSFRMPSFNDLYYVFVGNRSLRPEKARQYNLGATWQWKGMPGNYLNIAADLYYNRIADKIIAIPAQNLFMWTMLNIGKSDIRGMDISAEAGYAVSREWKLLGRLAYTLQKAVDLSNPALTTYKNELPYTPRHSGSFFAGASWRSWSAGWSSMLSGKRYVLGDNHPANQVAGWMTHAVSLRKTFEWQQKSASIGFYANNIADTRYDVIRYYPMPGRNYGIQFQIQQL